jgi:hypothetical protein
MALLERTPMRNGMKCHSLNPIGSQERSGATGLSQVTFLFDEVLSVHRLASLQTNRWSRLAAPAGLLVLPTPDALNRQAGL